MKFVFAVLAIFAFTTPIAVAQDSIIAGDKTPTCFLQ